MGKKCAEELKKMEEANELKQNGIKFSLSQLSLRRKELGELADRKLSEVVASFQWEIVPMTGTENLEAVTGDDIYGVTEGFVSILGGDKILHDIENLMKEVRIEIERDAKSLESEECFMTSLGRSVSGSQRAEIRENSNKLVEQTIEKIKRLPDEKKGEEVKVGLRSDHEGDQK